MTIVISLNDFENTYIQVHVTCQTRGLLFKASVVFRKQMFRAVSASIAKSEIFQELGCIRQVLGHLRKFRQVGCF